MEKTQTEIVKFSEDSFGTSQFLTFYIEDRFLGIDILHVKEINIDFTLTPIFHAPKQVRGFVNLRGQIYLILDLRVSLDLNQSEEKKEEKIILIKDKIAGQTGIIVDEIGDVLSIKAESIELSSFSSEIGNETNNSSTIVSGVCKLKDQLLLILGVHNILDIIKLNE